MSQTSKPGWWISGHLVVTTHASPSRIVAAIEGSPGMTRALRHNLLGFLLVIHVFNFFQVLFAVITRQCVK